MRYLPLFLLSILLFSCDPPIEEKPSLQSLDYKIDTIQKQAKLDRGDVYFEFYIENIQLKGEKDSLLVAIEDSIQKHLLTANINFAAQVHSYQALFDSISAEYQRLLKSDYPPYSPWDLSQSLRIVHNGNGVFSYESTHGAFTGGAHPNRFSQSQFIRLKDGRDLPLDSLVIAGKMNDLLDLGEQLFRNEYQLSELSPLNDAGFWFDENQFRFPENFTMDSLGLHFHYNAYDIAPYAMGHFFVDIPDKYLSEFIKPQYLLNPKTPEIPES